MQPPNGGPHHGADPRGAPTAQLALLPPGPGSESRTHGVLCVLRWLPLWERRRLDAEVAAVEGQVVVRAAGGAAGLPGRRREQQQLLPLQVEPGGADEGPAVAQGTRAGGHRAGHGGRGGRERGRGAAPQQQGVVICREEEDTVRAWGADAATVRVSLHLTPLPFLLPQEKGKAGRRGGSLRPQAPWEGKGPLSHAPSASPFLPTALVLPSADSKAGTATNS